MPITAILYDGWPLCRSPLSSPALHLLDIISNLPDGVSAHLAFPENAPEWPPDGLTLHRIDTADTPAGNERSSDGGRHSRRDRRADFDRAWWLGPVDG